MVQNLPLFYFFIILSTFYCFFSTNLLLGLITLSYFYQICKNVPLLDQKSRFFRNLSHFLFLAGLVCMLSSLCEIIWPMPRGLTNQCMVLPPHAHTQGFYIPVLSVSSFHLLLNVFVPFLSRVPKHSEPLLLCNTLY